MSRVSWAKGEVPKFALCENGSRINLWHLRRIDPAIGLKLDGGIDTPSFCGLVKHGWDLNVRIEEGHLEQACSVCVRRYRAEKTEKG